MKGKIDIEGFLQLKRAGKMKTQGCPYTGKHCIKEDCGDWCPLFGEPEFFVDLDRWEVSICGFIFEFDEFEDERR